MIDFSPINSGEKKLADLAAGITAADLRAATHEQIDGLLALVHDLSDAEVAFVASDPQAEGGVGWSVGHALAHATATSEEGAAVSSILARGLDYPVEPRLRVEADWTTLNTVAACVQRLEESRRIQLGYLSAWPDHPRLDTHRALPERLVAIIGPMNAVASYLSGPHHASRHLAQLEEIVRQARRPGEL